MKTKVQTSYFSPLHWFACGCLLIAGVLLLTIWTKPVEFNTAVWADTDFSNYWIASVLLLDGRVLDLFSGHDTYFAHLQAVFGADYPWRNWSYPPSYVLLIWPLGLMQLATALVIFQLVTALLFLHALSRLKESIAPGTMLLLVAFVACNVATAQNGFLTAALMLYGLALRDRSPVLAGIAFGLLTIKPQLGLLVPLLLLYEQRWTAILSAVVTTVALVVTSALLFGWEAWVGYIHHNVPYQSMVMTDMGGIFLRMMPSLFGSLRFLEIDAGPAMLVHGGLALVGLALFALGLRRIPSLFERSLLLLMASFVIAPYSLVYDMGALSAVAAIAAYRVPEGRELFWWKPFFSLVALLPLLHFSVGGLFGLPVSALVLTTGLLLLIFRREPQTP